MDNVEEKQYRVAKRIIREFSEQFNKKITIKENTIIFEEINLSLPIYKVLEKMQRFQEELLENALPLALFHLYEDLIQKQAEVFLLKNKKIAEFEEMIITYRPMPPDDQEPCKNEFISETRLPLCFERDGLQWVLGVQCGNRKLNRFLIKGHAFVPLTKLRSTPSEKELITLITETQKKWSNEAYFGEMGQKTGLFYLFGSRIADLIINKKIFHLINQTLERNQINASFTSYGIVSRNFVLLSDQKHSLNELKEITKTLHLEAQKDESLKEVFGVDDINDLLGAFHQPNLIEKIPLLPFDFNLEIKLDRSGGDILAFL